MKSKSLLSIKKKLQGEKKGFVIIIRNYYFKKSNYLENSFDGEQTKTKYQDVLKIQFWSYKLISEN